MKNKDLSKTKEKFNIKKHIPKFIKYLLIYNFIVLCLCLLFINSMDITIIISYKLLYILFCIIFMACLSTCAKNNNKNFFIVLVCDLFVLITFLFIIYTFFGNSRSNESCCSRKTSIGTEGLGMIDGAEVAFQVEELKGEMGKFSSTDTVCFDLTYLCKEHYFEKGCDGLDESGKPTGDHYTGSVLAYYNEKTNKREYSFWISNGTYVFGQEIGEGINEETYKNNDDESAVKDGEKASSTCGKGSIENLKDKNIIYCTGTSCE